MNMWFLKNPLLTPPSKHNFYSYINIFLDLNCSLSLLIPFQLPHELMLELKIIFFHNYNPIPIDCIK